MNIPEGYTLVPVEPTPEMRHAFHDAYESYKSGDGECCPDSQWAAMLAAAPVPPQADAQPLARVEVGSDRNSCVTIDDTWLRSLKDKGVHQVVALYAHADTVEVKRLRAENTRLDKANLDISLERKAAIEGWDRAMDECDTLRAQLAEQETLAKDRAEEIERRKDYAKWQEQAGEKIRDEFLDALKAVVAGSTLSFHPWPVGSAEVGPLDPSNPIFLIGGKDGTFAIRPFFRREPANAEPAAEVMCRGDKRLGTACGSCKRCMAASAEPAKS